MIGVVALRPVPVQRDEVGVRAGGVRPLPDLLQALVARPEDFYAWGGPATGKYVPWSDVANRREFQRDLRRLIELRLAGGEVPTSTTPAGPAGRRCSPT